MSDQNRRFDDEKLNEIMGQLSDQRKMLGVHIELTDKRLQAIETETKATQDLVKIYNGGKALFQAADGIQKGSLWFLKWSVIIAAFYGVVEFFKTFLARS